MRVVVLWAQDACEHGDKALARALAMKAFFADRARTRQLARVSAQPRAPKIAEPTRT